jgi:hypothetical protein
VVEPVRPVDDTPPREPHPFLGYGMVLSAATLWAVNGVVSKVILDEGWDHGDDRAPRGDDRRVDLWLGEALRPAQLTGGPLVPGGIVLAQTAR